MISKNLGFILIAKFNKKTIAGAIFFNFGSKAIFKYGASHTKYQNLGANHIVMWEAIKWYTKNGYSSLNMGRTLPENDGLRNYKKGWGGEEYIIKYFKYNVARSIIVKCNLLSGFKNMVCKILPVPILKIIGTLLYKHFG